MRLPDGVGRMFSPSGDSREHEVHCLGRHECRTLTWALDGICNTCHEQVCECPLDGDGLPECAPEPSADTWSVDA